MNFVVGCSPKTSNSYILCLYGQDIYWVKTGDSCKWMHPGCVSDYQENSYCSGLVMVLSYEQHISGHISIHVLFAHLIFN